MNAARSATLVVLLLAACEAKLENSPRSPEAPKSRHDYLDLMDGLVVIDRSGELHLTASAMNAIDGLANSAWTTPPGDVRQDLTIAFPARTRITRLGISNASGLPARGVGRIAYEWSPDGKSFQPLQTITVTRNADHQLFDSRPVDALALRASILGTIGDADGADLYELLIQGTELETYARPTLTGTWKLNELSGDFSDSGNRVLGIVRTDPPTFIDGAWSGRMVNFAWVRGAQFGVGVLVPDRSGQKLNGYWWFREAIPPYFGYAWFGERAANKNTEIDPFTVSNVSLTQRQTYPVFQLRFDESNQLTQESLAGIDFLREIMSRNPGKRFRIVANTVRGASATEDLDAAGTQVASIRQAMSSRGIPLDRFTFSPMGRQYLRQPEGMLYYIRLHSRVDLEVIEETSP